MKLCQRLLALMVVTTLLITNVYGSDCCSNTGRGCEGNQISTYDNFLSNRDFDALYDFINTKRTINLNEKGCNLSISGDLRVEWRNIHERTCGKKNRGITRDKDEISDLCVNGPTERDINFGCADIFRNSANDFDIEFNLRLDYVCGRAWGVAQLWCDNSAGVWSNCRGCCDDPQGYRGSGSCCDICLKKAYMGYNVCCCYDTRFDVELGRRNLYDVFDSQIQFLSRFDGILLRFATDWCCIAKWYLNGGGFLIDERDNHFGWVVETGLLNIYNSGIDIKYSYIDWVKYGVNVCGYTNPDGFKFNNSQITVYYNFCPEILNTSAYLFGAFLINTAPTNINHFVALENVDIDDSRQNLAWYAGFQIGEVVEEGDWAFIMQYQYVEALSIPDQDVSGIGRGNTCCNSITHNGRGNTNYRGFRFEGLYALTDNLNFDTKFEYSTQINSHIGGSHSYSNFQIEAIYAF